MTRSGAPKDNDSVSGLVGMSWPLPSPSRLTASLFSTITNVCRALLFIVLIATAASSAEPEPLHTYALDLIQRGEHEKALNSLEQAYGLFSQDPLLKKNLASTLIVVGRKALENNRFDEAIKHFSRAGELFPDDPGCWALRGIALYGAKDFDRALYDFEKARQLGGERPDLLYYIGRIHYDRGETAHGVEMWDKALALRPEDPLLKEALAKAKRELDVEARMERGESGRFSLSFDATINPDLADGVLDALEEAYNAVGSDLSWFPLERMPVLLYTKKDFASVTGSPGWSGGVYDGKIRLPIGGVNTVDDRFRALLRHEYTHVVVHEMTRGNCPVWLNEGLAEVQGRKVIDTPAYALSKVVKDGKLLPLSRIEGSFSSFSRQEALLAYEQSHSLVAFLISSYGWHKIREVLLNLGQKMSMEDATARAFADYGLTYGEIVEEWTRWLKKRAG